MMWPQTIDEWEDGFRRDEHPIPEIEMWIVIGKVYSHIATQRAMTPEEKQATFGIALSCTMKEAEPEKMFAEQTEKILSREQVKEIICHYLECVCAIRGLSRRL